MLHTRVGRDRILAVALGVLVAACGPTNEFALSDEFALSAVPGTYNDGSGRTGLAALLTLRDRNGQGPAAGASGEVLADGATVQTFQVADAEAAATGAYVWPAVPVSPGSRYTLRITVQNPPEVHTATLKVPDHAPLTPPELSLTDDGQQLRWMAPEGAVTFACEASVGGVLQLHATTREPTCDVGALPPGSYVARVRAFGSDPETVRLSREQRPALPAAFHVSESRLGFMKGEDGTVALRASAVGGHLDYGARTRGLAVWLSLTGAGGVAPAEEFAVEVVGPGLPASAPMTATYPAGGDRFLIWSYDVEARPGPYSLLATSSTRSVSATFSVMEGAAGLPLPTSVAVTAAGAGGADVVWGPVAGAASYFVGVWTRSSGLYSTGRWVTGTSTRFDPGTFTSGTAYDVYVAASSVDMTLATTPERLAVSENAYAPAGFIAK